MRVIVCAGRAYGDRAVVLNTMRRLRNYNDVTVVHGGCPEDGQLLSDRLIADVAEFLGYEVEEHPAEWYTHDWTGDSPVECFHRPRPDGRCPAAGPRRNQKMADLGGDLLIRFPGGRGTADMAARATSAGIPVMEVGA